MKLSCHRQTMELSLHSIQKWHWKKPNHAWKRCELCISSWIRLALYPIKMHQANALTRTEHHRLAQSFRQQCRCDWHCLQNRTHHRLADSIRLQCLTVTWVRLEVARPPLAVETSQAARHRRQNESASLWRVLFCRQCQTARALLSDNVASNYSWTWLVNDPF